MLRRKNFKILFLVSFLGFITGCATSEYAPLPSPPSGALTVAKKAGVYHKVERGQTLWTIAQAYGVSLKDIIESNNIPDAGTIEVNQLLFIPGAKALEDISVHAVDNNKNEFAWPIKGKVVLYFNDPLGANTFSRGIDIQAQAGQPVKAAREGEVILAGYMSGYGQTVMIDHRDGFISVYARNDKLLVKLGEYVYKGDPVAQVGLIGGGLFEHFEIRRGSQATNPLYYLP